jgi:hypothetical protein
MFRVERAVLGLMLRCLMSFALLSAVLLKAGFNAALFNELCSV